MSVFVVFLRAELWVSVAIFFGGRLSVGNLNVLIFRNLDKDHSLSVIYSDNNRFQK